MKKEITTKAWAVVSEKSGFIIGAYEYQGDAYRIMRDQYNFVTSLGDRPQAKLFEKFLRIVPCNIILTP